MTYYPTPGYKHFREQLLKRFEFPPELKTKDHKVKYATEILQAVRMFDDVVLFETAECKWNTTIMPKAKVWLVVCGRYQGWVNLMNRDLSAMMELNDEPSCDHPNSSTRRATLWWP